MKRSLLLRWQVGQLWAVILPKTTCGAVIQTCDNGAAQAPVDAAIKRSTERENESSMLSAESEAYAPNQKECRAMLEISFVAFGIIVAIAIIFVGLFSRYGRKWNEL